VHEIILRKGEILILIFKHNTICMFLINLISALFLIELLKLIFMSLISWTIHFLIWFHGIAMLLFLRYLVYLFWLMVVFWL